MTHFRVTIPLLACLAWTAFDTGRLLAADVNYPTAITASDDVVIGGSAPITLSGSQTKIGGGQIWTSGNVGVGTSSPVAELHVIQSAAGYDSLYVTNSASNNVTRLTAAAGFSNYLDWYTGTGTGALILRNAGTEQMRIDATGNVGIGTTAPANRLHVVSSTNLGARIDISTANAATGAANLELRNVNATVGNATGLEFENSTAAPVAFISGVNTNQAAIGSQSGGLAFSVANAGTWSQPLTINSSGNIGIGTTAPTNKLTVIGTISAMEVKVTTTGADYVFEDGYRLRPLDEVAQYVAREKHLPDIVPAKQMQAEGIPLSEVVTKQLAKIEELTLYAISLKANSDDLHRQIDKLKNDQEIFRKQMLAALAEIKDRH